MKSLIEFGLLLTAFGQGLLAVTNLRLVRLLHWEEELARMPLLLQQVFRVHCWFISATLLIFAALTWRFSSEMTLGVEPVYRWLAAGIGAFWGLRAILQVTYYSSAHWRGDKMRTFIHGLVFSIYTIWAILYLTVAFIAEKLL